MQNIDPQPGRRSAHGMGRRILGTVAGLTLAVGALQVASPAKASATAPICEPRTTSGDWKTAITDANEALAKAQTRIANGHYKKATKQLRKMKRKIQVATTAATALIGKPPTDPESDDPPGPTAVLKVSGLDHKVTMALIPLFADPHGAHVVAPLAKGLLQADACRDLMLDSVIALSAGKRDDYVDGLSDTLPVYDKEKTALATELAGDGLTSGGRDALKEAQAVVSETAAAMEKVFGGGERSPHTR